MDDDERRAVERGRWIDLDGIAEDLDIKPDSARTLHKRSIRNRRAGRPKPGDLPPADLTVPLDAGPDSPDARSLWLIMPTYVAWKASRPGMPPQLQAARSGQTQEERQ